MLPVLPELQLNTKLFINVMPLLFLMTLTVPPDVDVDLILWIREFLSTHPLVLVFKKKPNLPVPLPFNSINDTSTFGSCTLIIYELVEEGLITTPDPAVAPRRR